MTYPTDYVYLNGVYYDKATGLAYDPYKAVQDITEANLALLTPSTDFIGIEYDVVDRNGGTRVKNTGTTYREVSMGASEAVTSSTWAARGTGLYVGQTKRIIDLGNNPLVEVMWNGTYWVPRGGEQTYYELDAEVVTASGTNRVVTFPTVIIQGGVLNIYGSLLIEYLTNLSVDPTAATDLLQYGATDLINNTGNATSERRYVGRELRNRGAANSQVLIGRASANEAGGFAFQTTGPGTPTENSAIDKNISGSVTYTNAAGIGTLHHFRILWRGK